MDVSFDDIGGSEVRGERWMLVLMILVEYCFYAI